MTTLSFVVSLPWNHEWPCCYDEVMKLITRRWRSCQASLNLILSVVAWIDLDALNDEPSHCVRDTIVKLNVSLRQSLFNLSKGGTVADGAVDRKICGRDLYKIKRICFLFGPLSPLPFSSRCTSNVNTQSVLVIARISTVYAVLRTFHFLRQYHFNEYTTECGLVSWTRLGFRTC